MNISTAQEMRRLVNKLNRASELYYNEGKSFLEDDKFDAYLSQLKQMEKETGIVFSDSPTVNVGTKVLGSIKEVTHDHPMLSLDKCHSAKEIINFAKGKTMVAMTKADGLTCTLKYSAETGELVKAETRGNGVSGQDVLEHARMFKNIPLKINGLSKDLVVDGEAIIKTTDFEAINTKGEYKNPRNLAAGTLASLDTSVVKERRLSFVAWDMIEGSENNSHLERLLMLQNLGFEIVPYEEVEEREEFLIDEVNENIKFESEMNGIPYDGVVWKFDDIAYGKSLGRTEKFFRNAIAFKFEDEKTVTTLKEIEWSLGKTGILSPVAVFKPVELEGSVIERSSVHNVSILRELNLAKNDEITVFKANQIIPQIAENLTEHDEDVVIVPSACPVCGGETKIVAENKSEVLYCMNPFCKGKLLGKLKQFCSKEAMNIKGLSEQTLEAFIEKDLIASYKDLYHLKERKGEMINMPGLGIKSANNILKSIEASRKTTLTRFLTALTIPNVGKTASKCIEAYLKGKDEDILQAFLDRAATFDWTIIEGIGDVISKSIHKYFKENYEMVCDLVCELEFENEKAEETAGDTLKGKSFVITGSLNVYKNRTALTNKITSLGGKVVGSISKNTNYLICNDKNSTSSKTQKAIKLNVSIITEKEFNEMIGE